MVTHNWTVTDDLIGLFMYNLKYKYNSDKLLSIAEVAKIINVSEDSLKTKIRNYLYIDSDGQQGAPKYSPKSKRVYDIYNKHTELDMVMEIAEKNKEFLEYYKRLLTAKNK